MGALTNKVRLYDLAKELKIDTKRLIEEVRREGVDVSVPSNSVSKELADKIRDKYFPKKDTAVKRAVKVVKKAARPVVEEAPAEAEPVAETAAAAEPETLAAEEAETPATVAPSRVIRKLSPAARAERPAATTPAPAEPLPDVRTALPPASTDDGSAPAPEIQAPSRQVRVLRPTAAALSPSPNAQPGPRARRSTHAGAILPSRPRTPPRESSPSPTRSPRPQSPHCLPDAPWIGS